MITKKHQNRRSNVEHRISNDKVKIFWTPAFAGVTALYESDGFRSFGVLYSIFDILRFYFSQCKKSVLDCDHHTSAQSCNIHILC